MLLHVLQRLQKVEEARLVHHLDAVLDGDAVHPRHLVLEEVLVVHG